MLGRTPPVLDAVVGCELRQPNCAVACFPRGAYVINDSAIMVADAVPQLVLLPASTGTKSGTGT